jgi:predicted nucleotidyltransferase
MSVREEYILNRIRSTIRSKDSSAEIILFGSRARGTAHSESDWDLLILLNREDIPRRVEQDIRHSLIDIELETGEAFSTFVFSKNEWESTHWVTPFYSNIKNEGKRIA